MTAAKGGPVAWSKEFADPGNWYRGAPFWSWNERLTPEECVRQSRDMLRCGMGGGFMHSREGLETPYMRDEWMACIKAVVADSRSTGFQAWLYDEDRWPSGAGGGMVTIPHPEYRLKALIYDLVEATEYRSSDEDLAAFGVELAGQKITSVGGVSDGSHVMTFRRLVSETSGWYNDGAYLDTLDADAVRCFIDSTYEAYRKAVGDDFAKTVPGIFTDEPNFGSFRGAVHRPYLPWTDKLPATFEKRYGYSILGVLPCLFFRDVKGMKPRKVRRDYWDCVTHLFVTNFSKQIGDWCERNHIALTGHYLAEGTLISQTRLIGAAMRHYEHEQVPGIDILRESISEDLTVKQCSSVARQMGRDRVLSELYGCTGWDFSFEGQKWVGDWQFAGGVNYRCQHLALYGLRGLRKRDYPPSFNYQSPWWDYNKSIEDYFARLSYMLSRGSAVRDVAVIHPIESTWAQIVPEDHSAAERLDKSLSKVMKALNESHADFDFVDEEMLSRLGRTGEGKLTVGEASYKVVLVPPCLTLRASTVESLTGFAKSGGRVLLVKPLPKLIDCESSSGTKALAKRPFKAVAGSGEEITRAVGRALGKRVRIRSSKGQAKAVRYQLRESGASRILFICNTDRQKGCDLKISLPAEGEVAEWGLPDGSMHSVPSKSASGQVSFACSLGPTGSGLYVVGPGVAMGLPEAKKLKAVGKKITLKKQWDYELTEPNALTLDFCRYTIDSGHASPRMPVWRAQREIRRELGLPESSTGGVQRWKAFPRPKDTGRSVAVELDFEVKVLPRGPVHLVVERPEIFTIEVNGRRVEANDAGWFVDRSFRKEPVTGAIQAGRNKIRLSTSYHEEYEIEDCYLVGDFGVDSKTRAIVGRPDKLSTGSWVEQRLPFYSGAVIYKQRVNIDPKPGKRVFLDISKCDCTLLEVLVNGQSAGVAMWPPFEVDITELVTKGSAEIGIKVVSSRKNLMGPLHHTTKKLAWTGAAQFRTEGPQWTDDYNFVPYGIRGPVRVEYRR